MRERAEGEKFPHRRQSAQRALMNRDSLWFLEFCCRKAGRKREGRKKEDGHGNMERGGKGERKGGLEMRVRKVRAYETEEGPSSPFYSGLGDLAVAG